MVEFIETDELVVVGGLENKIEDVVKGVDDDEEDDEED